MNLSFLFLVGWLCLFLHPGTVAAQSDYPNHNQLAQRLSGLARSHPGLVKLESIAKTHGGKDIWLLSIGAGDLAVRPAIAIVGGVEGDRLLGTELAVQFAEMLMARATADAATRALLDSVTFYVFPDVSPDAREQYFAPLRYERLGNAKPSDLDRDGKTGEDPYNDLNGDGMITRMRIMDPTGSWMVHPDDERVMVKAEPDKGQRGTHHVYSEGIDNDKDGRFNEDGEEGVFFNRNFSFNYPAFTSGAGEHAVSEIETRAIADFLFAAKNVFAVISFGTANNLSEPLRFNEREAGGRIPLGWQEKDIVINQMVSLLYNRRINPKNETGTDVEMQNTQGAAASRPLNLTGGKGTPGSDGDFFQWAYFHYGRDSFSTPGWWLPATTKPATTGEGDTPSPSNEQAGPSGARRPGAQQAAATGNPEVEYMRWAEENNLTGTFVPWKGISHPDFPGKEVEVGGIAPFVLKNPPYAMAQPIAERHTAFILDVAWMRPQIDLVNVRTETLGNNLFRVTAEVINKGSLPTVPAHGQRVRWVKKTVVRLTPAANQELISGKSIEVLDAIDGHSSTERSWLVKGRGSLMIRAGAENTGFRELTITL